MTSADTSANSGEPTFYDVLVVGAGFAGIAMAMALERRGCDSYAVIERASELGGTWRDNTYPGAACDVPSHLYSFSFSHNPEWSRVFSPQHEIWAYQKKVVEDAGIGHRFLYDHELLSATWDEESATWLTRTPAGDFRSRFLIPATGNLSEAKYPAIPGIERFEGIRMHSAAWDASVQLDGVRAGVVGTGASAVQIVPELARTVGELTVFQRSAPYVTPRHDRAYTDAEKRLFARDPHAIDELRAEMFWFNEGRFVERQAIPALLAETSGVALDHLAAQVSDPELRAKLTPDYQIGCKRILKSQDYYPALTADHVTLETRPISAFTPEGAVLSDGTTVELDVAVFATGFEASDPLVAYHITGRDGVLLSDQWQSGMQAFATTAVHNFPNLFVLKGPNSGLGHNSIIYIIEAQVDYVVGALEYAFSHGVERMEIPRQAEDDFTAALDARAAGTVWLEGGCHNWYVDPRSGRLTTVWPDFAHSFRDEISTFDAAPYTVERVAAAV